MSSVVNCCSSCLGQSDHFEDGGFWSSVQKESLKEMIMHIMNHELKPDFESLVRNTVREEFRNLFNGLDRSFGDHQMHTSEPRCLKLQFLKSVSLPVFTNEEIQGEGPSSIEVALVDNLNEKVVDYGPESSAKVEIVALEGGDNSFAEEDDLTSEEFNRNIVREREGAYSKGKKNKKKEGKKPLLDGNVHLHLNKGLGVVGKVKFRQYSRWMKNHKYKLGARVLDSFNGVRIQEAVTKPFLVRDRRIKCERNRGPPSLLDDVSKLKNIRKDSRLHKNLQKKNINTVEDFLVQLFKDPEHLEQVLGLKGKLWEVTVKHAQMCATDKRICYYYSSQRKIGVVFNIVEQVLGIIISGCKFSPVENLSDKDKVDARLLAISAFDHWKEVHQFHDLNSLLEYVDNKLPTTAEETTNLLLPKLLIPPTFQDVCLCTDSSASVGNVENSQELNVSFSGDDFQSPNSSSPDDLMDFVENYFRQQKKAQKCWKKLSIVVRISMKKW